MLFRVKAYSVDDARPCTKTHQVVLASTRCDHLTALPAGGCGLGPAHQLNDRLGDFDVGGAQW